MSLYKVFVYYTGGTIGMIPDAEGKLKPAPPGKFTEELQKHPELCEEVNCDKWFHMPRLTGLDRVAYQVEEVDNPIDSTDLRPSMWSEFTKKINEKKNEGLYDGYIIIQGTDTMAYTSSALSFMLEDIKQPVILTGSQKSLFDRRSDAVGNLQGSLIMAGCYSQKPQLQQVMLFFDNKLFQGNRVTKFDADGFNAFDSPKYPPLAEMGVTITVTDIPNVPCPCNTALPQLRSPLNDTDSNACLIHLFPGVQESYITSALKAVGGAALASFGAGNVPDYKWLKAALREAKDSKILMINCSQLFKGKVLPIYEVSQWLADAGVVSGYDITIEAALAKLIWVLQLPGASYAERKKILGKNICGEMTIPHNNS